MSNISSFFSLLFTEPYENDVIIADELKSYTFNAEYAGDNFSPSQLLLFQLRKYLLLCWDALTVYEVRVLVTCFSQKKKKI